MSEPERKLLAIDLDGTLVDSAPDIAHCLGRALEAIGYAPPGEARTRVWIGDGLETLISRAIAHGGGEREASLSGEARHNAALAAFLACYRDNLFVRSRLYPGVLETLDAVRARGLKLCCVTNKRYAFSHELLVEAGIRDYFEPLLGGDSLPEKKPSPLQLKVAADTLGVAPSAAVLVGDSHQDLRAARAAGYGFVLASYGYGKIDETELGTSPRIRSFADLPRRSASAASRLRNRAGGSTVVTGGRFAHDVKTRSIVALVVVGAAAIAAVGLWRRPLPFGGTEQGNSAASVAPANASPSPNTTNANDAATEPRRTDGAWRTPSSPSPRYAEPSEIERQLEQFLAEQPGLVVASLSSIHCSATACEIALTGTDPSPRYVGAYSGLNRKLSEGPWTDFRMLYGGISTREVAPGAREYVIGFEYQPLVDLSADPLIAARQYAACAAAWRRQTEIGPHPDDEARYYLDQAEHYVALAASVLGEQEATRVAAETRGGPLIRECNPG